jgi:hypothetical protein
LSTSFERLLGIMIAVIAGLALSLGFLAALPGMAEAQDMAEASMEAEQNANLSNVSNANAPATAPPESQQGTRLVVSPGDSLWSISQEQLGLEATPQEIAIMADQIYEQNRDLIGDNPDLMLPSQELLVPLVLNPAAASEEPAAASEEPMLEQAPEPVSQSLDTPSNAPTGEEAVSEEENTPALVSSADSLFERRLLPLFERRLLGLGILALTLIVAILIVWRLPMRRDVGDHTASRGLHWEYYKNYAPPEAAEGLEGDIEEATSERGNSSSPTRGEDAMPASDHEVASPPAMGPQERLSSAHQLRKIRQRRRETPR